MFATVTPVVGFLNITEDKEIVQHSGIPIYVKFICSYVQINKCITQNEEWLVEVIKLLILRIYYAL
jgi:hypothetical protein